MPRKPLRPPVKCEFFTWRLLVRNRVWYADGRFCKHNLGKHSLATRDFGQAKERLQLLDRRKAVELGLLPTSMETVKGTEMPLAEGWEKFLAYCNRGQVLGGASPKTCKRYRAVRDKHLRFGAQHKIQTWKEIDKANTEQYGNWLMKEGKSDRTIYLELTLIKSVVGWLITTGNLPESRRLRLKLRKPVGTDCYCYTREEVHAMADHCQSRTDLECLGQIIVALACTGMQISELASLRWSDVDFRSLTIQLTNERSSSRRKRLGQVRTTKDRGNRTLPIHPELAKILRSLKRHGDGRLFHGPLSGILKPDTVRLVLLREVLKEKFPTPPGEIGFEHGRVHSFRHYFCSQAFLSEAAAADIQDWLGHHDSKMVMHYRHLRLDDSKRKIDQIDLLGHDDRSSRRSG